MSIYSLSYHSRNLVEDLTLDSLSEMNKILEVALSRNSANGVTGALMFNEGKFTQVLEGDQDAVKKIFDSIQRDPRHTDVSVLATQTARARRFSSWAMAFVGTSSAARAYYNNYTVTTPLFAKTVQQDKLCQLMLEMIELDQRHQSGA